MPDIGYLDPTTDARLRRAGTRWRAALLVAVAAAAAAGFLFAGPAATAEPELARLLRAMAGLKALMALALVAAVLWRLAAPIGPARFGLYAAACMAMAAGPGLVWGMTDLKLGAFLLHAGLLATLLLLWRDPAVSTLLADTLRRRRARTAAAPSGKRVG